MPQTSFTQKAPVWVRSSRGAPVSTRTILNENLEGPWASEAAGASGLFYTESTCALQVFTWSMYASWDHTRNTHALQYPREYACTQRHPSPSMFITGRTHAQQNPLGNAYVVCLKGKQSIPFLYWYYADYHKNGLVLEVTLRHLK